MTEATHEPGTADDAVSEERTPRAPFAGLPVRDLVRDGVASAALLVALALPWAFPEPFSIGGGAFLGATGHAHLEVVLAVVVALLALTLPYAHRAGIVTAAWAANEQRVRLVGMIPVVVVALVHIVLDVVPGDSWGVGAGLGLGLAAALLAAGPTMAATWPRTLWVVAGIVALLAIVSPILAATGDSELSVWGVLAVVLTALLALGYLWLTVWQYVRGDEAAGVLLVAVGIVVALGMALFAANLRAPWTETSHFWWIGLVLWPALAATAVTRVVRQTVGAGDQPRLWSGTAAHALLLATGLGAYVALLATLALIDGDRGTPVILRLVFGVIIAVVAFLGRRALVKDLVSGHAPAVGAALVVAVLGLVLLVVRAGDLRGVEPLDYLLTFGVPAVVLAVLLVPRSLRSLRAELAAAAPAEPADDDAVVPGSVGAPGGVAVPGGIADASAPTASGPRGVRTAGHRARNAGAVGAGAADGAARGDAGAAGGAEVAADAGAGGDAAAGGAPTVEVSPHEVAARAQQEAQTGQAVQTSDQAFAQASGSAVRPSDQVSAQDPQGVEEPTAAAQSTAAQSTAAQSTAAQSAAEQAPATQPPVAQAPAAQAPSDDVGATQVLPAVADQSGSRWTAAHAVDPATPLADLALIVQEAPHLRPYVASNPSTYPALLDWLGALGDPAIDAALRARR